MNDDFDPRMDRLVDLTSQRVSCTVPSVMEAVRRCDTGALSETDDHFAAIAREGKTVRLARTMAVPLRYFVAKMYHGPILVVSERIDRIFEWCREGRIAWQFDPAYTRMVPAHYIVEIDQVGCPDPAPRYHRFFNPTVGKGSPDVALAGAAYVTAAYEGVKTWLARVPPGQPIGVALSGGVDSTSVFLLARTAMEALGRDPDAVRAFTLDLGGGMDAAQAEATMSALGLERNWERVSVAADRLDLEEAIRTIEDYHPLDVECAATSLCLLRGMRERYPTLTYLLDGDGGDENLKSYPLEDSDLTLSSVLGNPLLYQEGWGVDAIKHSLVYSGGLSRSYVRTYAPAAAHGFTAFSPYTLRSVMAAALAIPFESLLAGSPERLSSLKQEVVALGVKAVTGVDMPINPKRRFQDGAMAMPRARASKAWCRSIFDRQWQQKLDEAEVDERRSGNEVTV